MTWEDIAFWWNVLLFVTGVDSKTSLIAKNRKIWKSLKSSLHTQIGLRISIICKNTFLKKLILSESSVQRWKLNQVQNHYNSWTPNQSACECSFIASMLLTLDKEIFKNCFNLLFRKMMEATTSPILAGKWVQLTLINSNYCVRVAVIESWFNFLSIAPSSCALWKMLPLC